MTGIIVIDKPDGWTSHDVIARLRRLLGERRIGHAGTLDPMATGVLPVFVGRATRAVEFCESDDKEYVAGLRLGVVTDTQDTTRTVLSQHPVDVTVSDVEAALKSFVGPQKQTPPMYSAVKIGGKKLYELARRGIEAERPARDVIIYSLALLGCDDSDYSLHVHCSKGTYVRTLCHDIGQTLGCGGTMSALRRTRAGRFTLQNAVTLDDVAQAAENGQAEALLSPVDSLFSDYPAVRLDEKQTARCRNGTAFPTTLSDGLYRVYDGYGGFLMLGRAEGGVMHTVKSFFDV